MAQFLTNIDLTKNEIQNVRIHVLASDPGSPVEGQVYYNSTDKTLKLRLAASWLVLGRLDQISAPTADVSLASQKITNLATPTAATDAATKGYIDALVQGINWKESVRAATTANGTLASAFANGQVIDGVTLATGDRILLKNQSAGAENGLYTVNASGVPTRATDADTGAELLQAAVFVREGTVNADTLWVNGTNGPITVGSTALVFAQLSGGTSYTGGNGISIAGTVIAAVADPAGGLAVGVAGIGVVAPLPITLGGTGGITAAAARTALGVPGRFAASVGDGVSTSIDVVHNLGTRDVITTVYLNASTWDVVICDVQNKDANTVTLIFAVAPTSNQYRVVVVG